MREKVDIKYVYLNDDLEIVDANREFYVYFDLNGHDLKTLDDFIPHSSRRSVLSLIKNKNKDSNFTVAKFLEHQTVPKLNVVQAYSSVFDGIHTTCLKIIDIEQSLKIFRTYRLDDSELIHALSLTDDCIFSYWQTDNIIKITQFYQNRTVVLYEQDIDEWAQMSIERKIIPKNQISLFNQFVEDLKACPKNFEATFESGLRTTNPNILENLTFTGVRFVDDEEIAVVGRILPKENAIKAQQVKKIIEEIQIDPLTKIYNKKTITSYAQKIINEHKSDCVTLIIMDLDHFKPVNDAFGHMAGDKVLAQTGEILHELVGDKGLVGRYGGDEFLLIVYGLNTELRLRGFLNGLRIKIANTFRGKFEEINITCSLGCASYPSNGINYEELFQKADFCLYRAKDKGRNRYVFFRDDLHGELYKAASQAKEGIKYDDREIQELKVIAEFIQDMAVSKEKALSQLMEHMIKTYNLDNITIFSGDEFHSYCYSGHKIEGFNYADYINLPSFKALLGEKNYIRIDFMENLPENAQDIKDILKKYGIKSTVQCLLGRPEKITGLITFNRTKAPSLWAEYEVNCAQIAASTLNLTGLNL